jgi:hypothetical protein
MHIAREMYNIKAVHPLLSLHFAIRGSLYKNVLVPKFLFIFSVMTFLVVPIISFMFFSSRYLHFHLATWGSVVVKALRY